jgi:hypothetical protein
MCLGFQVNKREVNVSAHSDRRVFLLPLVVILLSASSGRLKQDCL